MPSASFRHDTTAPVDVDTAWDRMQESEFWTGLGISGIAAVTHDSDGTLTGFTFSATVAGKRYAGTARTVEATPHRLMSVAIDSAPVVGRLDVLLVPAGGMTKLDVTAGLTARGLVATLSFPAITATVGSRFSRTVDRLAARLAG